MSRFIRYFLPLGLILLSALLVAALIFWAASQRPERRDDGPQAILVDTVTAESRSLNFVVQSQGAVRPRTETTLVSEVSGKVVSVSPNFVAGGFFRAGETLLEIDPSDYATAVKRAEAALASRQAQLADEQARADQAVKDWRNLGKTGEPPALVARKPQLADALANVQAAEADLDKARRDLQRTHISVPYDGLVREKRVDIGQYASPGTQLGVTFAVDTAEVRLPVSAADLAFLDLPEAADTVLAKMPAVSLRANVAGETRSWEARIIRTEGVIDESSRVLYTVAQVVDPYSLLGRRSQPELRMGTFVRAAIEGRHIDSAVVLPRHVLRTDGTVLVANGERELEVRDVQVARAEPDYVYITSGVEDGERVVTTTLDAPIPGTRLVLSSDERPESHTRPAADEDAAGQADTAGKQP